jgi:hypothetical protein
VMRRQTPIARQILQHLLRERITFRPQLKAKVMGYRFDAEGSLWRLFSATIPEVARVSPGAGSSPTGADHILRREYIVEIDAA